jgi:hypothetical protein
VEREQKGGGKTMSVLDTLALRFETLGAKDAAKETKSLSAEMDAAEQSAMEFAKKTEELKKQLGELQALQKNSSEDVKKQIAVHITGIEKELKANVLSEKAAKLHLAGVKQTEAAAMKARQQLTSMASSVSGLAGKMTGALGSLYAFKKAFEMSVRLGNEGFNLELMARQAGMTTDSLQVLGNALRSYGGDAASASAVVGDLNQSLQDMRLGKGGKLQEAASLYGLDISGSGEQGLATADELLMNIAKRMEGLNTQQQLNFGKMMGLDPATLMMVQGGVKGLTADLQKAGSMTVFSPEDIKAADEWKKQMIQMHNALERVGMVAERIFLPIMKAMGSAVTWLSNVLSEHQSIAIGVFSGVAAALIKFTWVALMSLRGLAIKAVPALAPLLASIWSLAAGVLAATWPFIAIAAAVAGVVWGIKKIHDMASGKKSGEKDMMSAGNRAFALTGTPLSSQTSNSIANNSSRSQNINVGIQGIEIKTAATDADGISKDLGRSINKSFASILLQNYSGALA